MKKRYAIITEKSIDISTDIEFIKRKAKQILKKRQIAIIQCDGLNIGFVGEDLTQRIGWGIYLEK